MLQVPLLGIMYEKMLDELASRNDFYDPRRLYDDAIKIRYEIEESRQYVANHFGCSPSEVIFTSSSTESLASFAYGINFENSKKILTSKFESKIIYEIIKCDDDQIIDIENIENEIDENTKAIFISYAHPDTGDIFDLKEIIDNIKTKSEDCLIHLDARNASGYVKIDFSELNVDAMSIESSTWGGPIGISALILKHGLHIEPLIKGATQERARRSGNENTLAIAGFGELCKLSYEELENEINIFRKYKEQIINIFRENCCEMISKNKNSLPNMVSGMIKGIAASAVVSEFNRHQINIHAGSACGSEEFEISPALINLGLNAIEAESVFRISWGYATTPQDIETFATALNEITKSFNVN